MVCLLQCLLETSKEAKPPKPNPVGKVLGNNVQSLVARASIVYPIIHTTAAALVLCTMTITELVSLLLEDRGGVVLPIGLCTHPLPLE